MKPELVIFDIAGTVLDEGSIAPILAFKDAFASFGVEITDEEVRETGLGRGKREHLDALCDVRGFDRESDRDVLWDALVMALDQRVRERAEWIEGARGTVEAFKKISKVGFTTGYMARQLRICQDALQASFALCREDVAEGRPHPDMILMAMDHFGIDDPSKVLKVGDTPSDMEAAVRAGAVPVGVGTDRHNLVSHGARAICEIGALPGVVEAL